MGVYKAANNAISTLVSISSTNLSVATAEGVRFPEITGTDWTYISIEDDANQIEVVKVTAHALAADVFTIVRAQKGTAEGSWAAGAVVEIRPHAEEFIEIYNHILDTADAHDASAISFTPAGGIAATDVQAALVELDTEKMPKTGGQFTGGVDITEGLTLDGAAGAVGQVPVSQGSGTPVWGASPASLGSTDTGTGSILAFSNATAAVNLIDLAAVTNDVDYRIAHINGTEYEVGSGTITYTNTGGRVWTEMFGDFDGAEIYGYAYNAGTYVVVGSSGKVLSSTDNINWTLRDGGFGSSSVYGVIYAGGQFVAAGLNGTLATSPDGIAWTQRASAATAMASNHIRGIAHDGGSLYTIVGHGGYIASSADGITWTNRKSSGSDLYCVAHGNGYFAAGGNAGALFVSTDGTTWNTRTSGFAANNINGMAYGNVGGSTPTFIAVGVNGTVTFSTDGTYTTWSAATSGFSATTINSVTFASSKFVAVGASGKISYDADGQGAWTTVTPVLPGTVSTVKFINNEFVAGGANTQSCTSADGVTWLAKGLALNENNVYGLMSNGTTTVAAGHLGYISSSTDLQTWTQRASGIASITTAIYGDKFVVSGTSGGVSTSADGATWTYYASAIAGAAYALAYGNGVYVIAGASGLLSTSATALTGSWTTRTSNFGAQPIYGVCYGLVGGVTHTYVAVGGVGVISSSTDGGVTWTARTSGTATQFEYVAFGNGRFVAVGQSGVVATSPDGTTWALSTPLAVTVNAITFSNGLFVAGGTTGRLFTSPDGITWIEQTTDHVGVVYALATIGTNYYAGRAAGVISSSPVGVPALSLTRAPYFSSNANALVGFTAGTKNVELIPNERNLNALTTTTTGTGDLTLASIRGSGALFANNGRASTVAYRILEGEKWEAGIGTLTNTSGMQQILSSAAGITVQSVLWDGTKFMAYGPTQTYAYSYDGIVWTTGSLTYNAGGYTGNKTGACYVNGLYVLHDSANTTHYTSTDGVSWTQRTIAGGYGTNHIEVAYGNGVYVSIFAGSNAANYSTNGGVTWTTSNPGTAASGITFGAGTFLLKGTTTTYYTSKDGVVWTSRTMPGNGAMVRYVNGLFVAVGVDLCYTSPDGINWTSRTISTATTTPYALTYGGGVLLVLGVGTAAAYSYDGGITWGSVTLTTAPLASTYQTCAYGKGRFLTAKNTTQPTVITPAISAFTLRRGCQVSSEVSNAPLSLAAGTKYVHLAPYVSPDADTAAIYTKQTAWVPAGAMLSRTTTGAAAGTTELATNKVMVSTLDFDTTTQEFAQFSVAMPKSWIEGAISAQVVWSHAATTTNFGVAWEIQAVAISDDDALDAAFSTAVAVTDTGGTTNDLYTTIETLVPVNGSPQPLDTVIFQIARAPANSGDTMAIDARLHGVRLYYSTDTVSDA